MSSLSLPTFRRLALQLGKFLAYRSQLAKFEPQRLTFGFSEASPKAGRRSLVDLWADKRDFSVRRSVRRSGLESFDIEWKILGVRGSSYPSR